MSYYLIDQTYEDLEEYVAKNAIVVLPVGTIEEHGKHLPIGTDYDIAKFIGDEIGKQLSSEIPLLIMESVWAGYSPKAMTKWPGIMRLRTRTFIDMMVDVCSSIIEMGFKKIVMLDCHGQHAPFLNVVTKEIADKYGLYIVSTSPLNFSLEGFNKVRTSPRGGVCHACEWETSMMLKCSDYVKTDKIIDEPIQYHSDFVAGDGAMSGQRVVWSTWGLQKSKTGIYGSPSHGSKEKADVIMKCMIENYRKFLKEYYDYKG